MIVYWECEYTKEQAQNIITAAGLSDPLPGKGKTLWLNQAGLDAVSIEKGSRKGTDKRTLYVVKLWR